jgi:hypothetical protein
MGVTFECRGLDERGDTFVRECFERGLSLSRSVESEVRGHNPGRTWAFVPATSSPDRLYKFDEGLVVGPTTGVLQALVALILEEASAWDGSAVVGESVLSRPSDPSMKRWSIPRLVCGEEVYPAVPATWASEARLLELIDYTDGLQGSCIFVVSDAPELPETGQFDISPERVCGLARTVQFAAVTAYDGEAFVIWSRRGEAPSPQGQ